MGTALAGFDILIVFVGHVARQECCRERLERAVVIRLDGIHVAVGHLGRAVHRHAHELRGTGAADIIVLGRGDDIIAVAVAGAGRGFILTRTGGIGIEQPERDIHALDLLDMVL